LLAIDYLTVVFPILLIFTASTFLTAFWYMIYMMAFLNNIHQGNQTIQLPTYPLQILGWA
jgi:hypothetical protein